MELTNSRVKGKLRHLLVSAAKRNQEWGSYVNQDSKNVANFGETIGRKEPKILSIKYPDQNETQTKLQDAAGKRVCNEQLKQNDELKRRKIMLSPGNLNMSSNIFTNPNLLTETLEEDERRGSFFNQENLECVIVLESLGLILPYLYPELQLSDVLTLRSVCKLWQISIDKFLNTHPTMLPFNSRNHLEEVKRLELGCSPSWNESPLTKLAKIYKFSNLRLLNTFTYQRKGKIVGSRVCLDNILLKDPMDFFEISPLGFLATFDVEIKYLEIRQQIEFPNFKIKRLMDRLKLCLWELSNLRQLKVVFMIDAVKFENEYGWDTLQALGNEAYESWHASTFPKLEYLETIEFDVEILEGWSAKAKCLRNFCKSLIRPYCKQIKKLSLIAHSVGLFECLDVPNLVELTIPRRYLCENVKLGCVNVEKCTIICHTYVLKHKDINLIQTLFPKLVCLGFKFEIAGGEFHDFLWTTSTPSLLDILTLELENCGAVTFTILCCFPNLRYLRLINKSRNKLIDSQVDDTVLNITKLCRGENLYKAQLFWEHFPNISLVTLEFNSELMQNVKSKFCTWTREGYINFWSNNRHKSVL